MSSINVNSTLLAAQNLGNRIQRAPDRSTSFRDAVARGDDGRDQRAARNLTLDQNNSGKGQSSATANARSSAKADEPTSFDLNPYLAGQSAANLSARGAAAALPGRRPLPPGSLVNIVV
jgi:hypothetical protein